MVNLARSALDQATRFDKRLIAARFIDYAVNAEHIDTSKMVIALQVLEAWGASVESAFTPPKVAVAHSESIKAGAGKDGLNFEHHSAGPNNAG